MALEEASLAPLGVVPGLDNTDGVIKSGLGHLTHRDHGVQLGIIHQYVIIIIITTSIATCNYYIIKLGGGGVQGQG